MNLIIFKIYYFFFWKYIKYIIIKKFDICCFHINGRFDNVYFFHINEDWWYCDCLSNDDKNLYHAGRSFNFGNSPRSCILAARTVHWIIIIISANFSREWRISYYPRGVTYPHPLFFISQRYKRNALLISRLLAIPPTRFFLLFSFSWPISDDTYEALYQFRSSIQHTRFMLPLRIQRNYLIYGFNITVILRVMHCTSTHNQKTSDFFF